MATSLPAGAKCHAKYSDGQFYVAEVPRDGHPSHHTKAVPMAPPLDGNGHQRAIATHARKTSNNQEISKHQSLSKVTGSRLSQFLEQ